MLQHPVCFTVRFNKCFQNVLIFLVFLILFLFDIGCLIKKVLRRQNPLPVQCSSLFLLFFFKDKIVPQHVNANLSHCKHPCKYINSPLKTEKLEFIAALSDCLLTCNQQNSAQISIYFSKLIFYQYIHVQNFNFLGDFVSLNYTYMTPKHGVGVV